MEIQNLAPENELHLAIPLRRALGELAKIY